MRDKVLLQIICRALNQLNKMEVTNAAGGSLRNKSFRIALGLLDQLTIKSKEWHTLYRGYRGSSLFVLCELRKKKETKGGIQKTWPKS